MFILQMINCYKANKLYKIKKGFPFSIKMCNNTKILYQKVVLNSIHIAQDKITLIITAKAIKANRLLKKMVNPKKL